MSPWIRVFAIVFFVVAIGAGAWLSLRLRPQVAEAPTVEGPELPLPESRAMWINGLPVPSDSLRGHVVAYVVWTESEPASLRLLPEVESWHRAYSRFGLRVIGVHAPSFVFAADTSVTTAVARRLGLTFPIALDPSYEFSGSSEIPSRRPAVVIADPHGRIVHRDGASAAHTDQALRQAIVDANPDAGLPLGIDNQRSGAPAQRLVHLGVSRVERGPLAGRPPGVATTFTAQFRFQEEGAAYVPFVVGRWLPEVEGVMAARGGAANYVSIRFDGGTLSAVLSPPRASRARVWILSNDEWLTRAEAGEDVRFDGKGAAFVDVDAPRLYSIARAPGDRVLKLSPDAPGITFHLLAFETPQGP